ncbi:MAG: YlxR family protein [Chloroflexi bacterium]|nr:YlxR family protein [Chloroflexota bacterium]
MKKRVRRQPQRTCIACRRIDSKRALVRLVRTPEGEVLIDLTGKRAGRGAYLCTNPRCWLTALEDGRIGRALKAELSTEERAHIRAYALELEKATAQETNDQESRPEHEPSERKSE